MISELEIVLVCFWVRFRVIEHIEFLYAGVGALLHEYKESREGNQRDGKEDKWFMWYDFFFIIV